jgi:hypothetical protein
MSSNSSNQRIVLWGSAEDTDTYRGHYSYP